MGSGALISVVIPTHNEFTLLARTLAGLAASRSVPTGTLEVIVVDNNSTESGLPAALAHFDDASSLTVVHQPQLPHPYALCRARNLAMAIARGRWIWTLDADCIPHPNALRSLLDAIDGRDEPLAFTGERFFVDPATVTPEDIAQDPQVLDTMEGVLSPSNYRLQQDRRIPRIMGLPDLEHPWDMMHGGNSVFRRIDALSVGGYDERFDGTWGYEDDEFAYRLVTRAGVTAHWVEGMTVFHQESAGNTQDRVNRPNKADNPNWSLVCSLIPGYREYKLATYSDIGVDIEA